MIHTDGNPTIANAPRRVRPAPSLYDAVMTVEQGGEDERADVRALQQMINAGAWGLQGSFGRAMNDAIQAGVCALGTEPARDYYGNYIPARSEIEPGAPGSVVYVEEHSPYGGVLDPVEVS